MKNINYFQRRGNDIISFTALYNKGITETYIIFENSINWFWLENNNNDYYYLSLLYKYNNIVYNDNFYKVSLLFVEEYDKLYLRFLKEKKKIKCREESKTKNKMYHTMHDFMNHNNLCYDIKAHILSFIF